MTAPSRLVAHLVVHIHVDAISCQQRRHTLHRPLCRSKYQRRVAVLRAEAHKRLLGGCQRTMPPPLHEVNETVLTEPVHPSVLALALTT